MSGYFPFSLQHGLMSSPTLTPPVYQDLVDYQGSGKIQSARYINPLTNDFEICSSNGQFMGENAIDQSVLMALTNTFNSTSVLGLGNQFGSVKLIGPNTVNALTNILTQCLGSLIANNSIVLGPVNIMQTDQGTMAISFSYYNQSLGVTQNVSFTQQNGANNG
jgi:hypothetical protein